MVAVCLSAERSMFNCYSRPGYLPELMEEAAQKRLERLKRFELGVSEPVIVGIPSVNHEESNTEESSPFTTVESLARRIVTENTFVPDQTESADRIESRKQNWDLKKEYERKYEPLQIKTANSLQSLLDKRLNEENK